MPLSRRQALSMLGACLALSPAMRVHAEPTSLLCGIIDLPPWVLRDTPRRGLGNDLVMALADWTNLPFQPAILPMPRMMRDFADGRINLALFVPHPDLERVGRVLGQVGALRMGVLLRPGLSVANSADLKGLLIGHVRSFGRLPTLSNLTSLDRVEEVADVRRGIDMLYAGRLDGYFGAELAIAWHLREQNLDRHRFGGFQLLDTTPLQLHASNASRIHPEVERQLIAACGQVATGFDHMMTHYVG